MDLYFLSAREPLTKTFTVGDVSPYPHVKSFTSHHEVVTSIPGFYDALTKHADLSHCLLKGKLTRELKQESRAGSTLPPDTTAWVCFDVDRIEGIEDVEGFIYRCLPEECHGVAYVVQYSASYVALGAAKGLSAHIFMLLDREYPAPLLKEWVRGINLVQPTLRRGLVMNAAGTTLKWRLDPTVVQNDKLIYIAPPICKGFAPAIPKHIEQVNKARTRLTPNLQGINPSQIDEEVRKHLNTLRKDAGLAVFRAKMKGDVCMNPGRIASYETKVDSRGFTYFNFNGGDSWAYWHPNENPNIIYNFKGEPNYDTKALLPEYWRQLKEQEAVREEAHKIEFIVLRDIKTALYHNGWYDVDTDTVKLFPARGKDQLQDFLVQHGYPKAEYIPDFTLTFDPQSPIVYDRENRVINRYKPSEYIKNATKKYGAKIPPGIDQLITHVTGNNQEVYDHFVNWLAVVVQRNEMAGTAWVLHGTQGTGKGVLIGHVLKPIIGADYVKTVGLDALEENFNPWMEQCLLLNIDEASIEDSKKIGSLMAKLKKWITDRTISVRPMHAPAYQMTNHVNVMVTTNMHDPIVIHDNDRRFNVATRQEAPITMTPKLFNQIQEELQDFCDYLISHEADQEKARRVIDTPERQAMKELTQSSVAVAAKKLAKGDLEFFVVNAPPKSAPPALREFNGETIDINAAYMKIIERAINSDGKELKLARKELYVLFEHTIGKMPQTPHKLTSTLKHHDIQTKRASNEGALDYIYPATFHVSEELVAWLRMRNADKVSATVIDLPDSKTAVRQPEAKNLKK